MSDTSPRRVGGRLLALAMWLALGAGPAATSAAERASPQALLAISAAARPHVERAVALYAAGDLAGATRALEAAALVAPRDPQVRFMLGNAHFRGDRFERAVPEYRAAAALRPLHPDTFLDLGFALFHSGRAPQAVEAWSEAVRLEPYDPLARLALAVGWSATGDTAQAARSFAAAIAMDDSCASHGAIGRDIRWREAGAAEVSRLARIHPEAGR